MHQQAGKFECKCSVEGPSLLWGGKEVLSNQLAFEQDGGAKKKDIFI